VSTPLPRRKGMDNRPLHALNKKMIRGGGKIHRTLSKKRPIKKSTRTVDKNEREITILYNFRLEVREGSNRGEIQEKRGNQQINL